MPSGVAVTPDGAHAYVAANDGVAVIETATNTVVATVALTDDANTVAITPDGAFAYVGGQDRLSVIATSTNTVVLSSISVGDARGVAITPDGAFAYVAENRERVRRIATATNTVVDEPDVGLFSPEDVAITPDGAFIYVTGRDFSAGDPGTVLVIETATNTIVASVSVGTSPKGLAITP